MRARLAELARCEQGMALVMTVGITMVLAIVGSSAVFFATRNETASTRSRADVRALQLAQTGIENAVSQLANTSGFNGDTWHRTRADLYTSGSSPLAGQTSQAFDTGESVSWTGTLYDDTPGSPSGSIPVRRYRWTLSATATVPNPASPAAPMTRTLSADVVMTPQPWTPSIGTQAWKYVYSKVNGPGSGCDVQLDNNPNYNMSFYVSGTLCLTNSTEIVGPTGGADPVEVIVKEGIYLQHPNTYIGQTRVVNRVETGGNRCRYHSNAHGGAAFGNACAPHHVNATTVVDISATPGLETVVNPPTASFADAALGASPGPNQPCETSSGTPPNFSSTGTFTINGGTASFTCVTGSGEFSYTAGSNVLKVSGLVYMAGNLDFDNVNVAYDGIAALYVGGWFHAGQTALCASLSGSSCNWSSWDTNTDVLLIAAQTPNGGWSSCTGLDGTQSSILLENQSRFQGALYADGSTNICVQNQTDIQGPVVAHSQVMSNSTTYRPMPPGGVVRIPFGAPGQAPTNTVYNFLPPKNYVG